MNARYEVQSARGRGACGCRRWRGMRGVRMSGECDLETLLRNLAPVLRDTTPRVSVFCVGLVY